MKKHLVFFVCSVCFMSACHNNDEKLTGEDSILEVQKEQSATVSYVANVAESKIHWRGTMMGMYAHEGYVDLIQGELTVENGKVKSGLFTVDMTSINPTDGNYEEGKTPELLIEHLSTDEFFHVKKFPTASFEFSNEQSGLLTVRDKTLEEKLTDVKIVESDSGMIGTARLTFVRQDYEVAFESAMKDMVLADEIELDLSIVAEKK